MERQLAALTRPGLRLGPTRKLIRGSQCEKAELSRWMSINWSAVICARLRPSVKMAGSYLHRNQNHAQPEDQSLDKVIPLWPPSGVPAPQLDWQRVLQVDRGTPVPYWPAVHAGLA